MEIWDAYNRDGSAAGCELIRGEKIPQGLYHIVADILVKHADGSILVMQRDLDKQPFPGQYEASAGGSILKGETPLIGAIRELREETGIQTDELMQYYTIPLDEVSIIYCGFLCNTNCAKDSITLQPGETIGYRWLSKKEFMEFIHKPEFVARQKMRWEKYYNEILAD